MRTKNKIRSRRTAQTKKEIKNKEKQKEKAWFRPSRRNRDFKIGAPPSPLAAGAASSADNKQDGGSRFLGSAREARGWTVRVGTATLSDSDKIIISL